MRFALERLKQVLEPAGAAALAARAGRAHPDPRRASGWRSSLSGGNVEVGRLGELLAGGRDAARRRGMTDGPEPPGSPEDGAGIEPDPTDPAPATPPGPTDPSPPIAEPSLLGDPTPHTAADLAPATDVDLAARVERRPAATRRRVHPPAASAPASTS